MFAVVVGANATRAIERERARRATFDTNTALVHSSADQKFWTR